MALEDEVRKLSRAFRRALIVAASTASACATASPETTPPDDAGLLHDAETTPDGGADGAALSDDGSADAACSPRTFVPDPPDPCGDYVMFPCGLPEGVAPRGDCFFSLGACNSMCPGIQFNCHAVEAYCLDGGTIVPDDAGAVVVDCSRCAGSVGRVPEGLEPRAPSSAPSTLAAYFSEAAHLEAASVFAFRAFARELSAYDAPPELVSAARAAERDEVRHARAVARLARRFGGRYVKPRVRAATVRPFEAFAQDNAVEGCVRETFGALVATWQAAHARDPEVARVLDAIAKDETEHAALSWAVLRWSFVRLGDDARERIADACARAIDRVITTGDGDEGRDEPALVDIAGLPPRRIRRAFADTLREELWSAFALPEDAAA